MPRDAEQLGAGECYASASAAFTRCNVLRPLAGNLSEASYKVRGRCKPTEYHEGRARGDNRGVDRPPWRIIIIIGALGAFQTKRYLTLSHWVLLQQ